MELSWKWINDVEMTNDRHLPQIYKQSRGGCILICFVGLISIIRLVAKISKSNVYLTYFVTTGVVVSPVIQNLTGSNYYDYL